MILLRLALASLVNRAGSTALSVLAIALSVALVLAVDAVREGARRSFGDTISGVDLIVGARGGSVQLLLYSVFRVGAATNNMGWDSYQRLAARPEVAWTVPLSLGDSHRGFRVIGTTNGYFEHLRYRGGRSLAFSAGGPFTDLFDAVIGAEVAETLGYGLGDPIIVAHGLVDIGASLHDDLPFRVTGILARTGTPVDRGVHVSLEAITAIHVDWQGGSRLSGASTPADQLRKRDLTPESITAVLVGVKNRRDVFTLPRWIAGLSGEPLSATLPGVALQELWSLLAVAERALALVAWAVLATALVGLSAMMLATLNERRREIAILRTVGAPPRLILALLLGEAAVLTAAGALAGLLLLYPLVLAVRPALDHAFGILLPLPGLGGDEAAVIGLALVCGILAGLPPALGAYRRSLADGMMVRL